MVIKDRLPELKAVQSKGKQKSSTSVLIEDKSDDLDNFFEEVQQIRDLIEKFQENVNQIKKVQNTILFGPQNDNKKNQELDDLMADTRRTLMKTKLKIQEMENNIKRIKSKELTNSELRIRKTQHSMLFKLFINIMKDYNESQLNYKQNCKERIKRQFEIMGKETSDQELEQLLETGNQEVFVQGIMRDTLTAKQSLVEINARHNDIIKIEKSIAELSDMFNELALLVENQGETIDRIEFEVINTSNAIEKGNVEIDRALDLRKSHRKKKIYCIIILLVILALFVIAFVLSF